jgi:hypothetical protein
VIDGVVTMIARIWTGAASALAAIVPHSLRRPAKWATIAAVALLCASLAAHSDTGMQRSATLSTAIKQATNSLLHPDARPSAFDAEAANRQLQQQIRILAEDRERLVKRLAAVEHNMDDLTGSVSRQIDAVKAAAQAAQEPAVTYPPMPASAPAIAAPATQPAGAMPSAAASPSTPNSGQTAATEPGAAPAFGVDIGTATSIKTLHARWEGVRSSHTDLFDALTPVVAIKTMANSREVELRLVAGPLPDAKAAAAICAVLATSRQFCRPTTFSGPHFALQ